MSLPTADLLPSIALPLGAGRTSDLETDLLTLFDACAPALTRYARGCGLPADVADDIVQEAFMALFRHLGLGRPRENLRGWLFTVVHRQAQKHRRRMARRRTVELIVEPLVIEARPSPDDDPEATCLAREAERRLRSAFAELPERQQQALLLRSEGLTYRDIAHVLGMSLGGVAKTLGRGLAQLAALAGDGSCA
jgi:RNA polymerase sigma-70 factor, ECF subfamily